MDRYVFFGGKGGVGKTTVSCAYALKCANAGLETLVVSTDPAHSTADVFDQPFDDEPRRVEGIERLSAMEIDPDEEVTRHLNDIRRSLSEQVSASMVNEINRQIEMSHGTPGAYEAALLDRFVDVMRESDPYDRVVFDTSPTGGTLRLLGLPEHLGDWINRLMAKRKQSIKLFERAAIGNNEPRRVMDGDPVLARLQERRELFEYARETLATEAAFYLVFNPDELSVKETRRAADGLADRGFAVRGLVANKLTPEPDDDENGRGARFLRDRVATERERLATVREEFPEPLVAEIRTRTGEIKGDFLDEVADELAIDVRVDVA